MLHPHRMPTRLRPRAVALVAALLATQATAQPHTHSPAPAVAPLQVASASVFNDELLAVGGDQAHADLSLFAFGNRVLPGEYTVDTFVNGRSVGQDRLRFDATPTQQDARPCLTAALLERWGVQTRAFAALSTGGAACVELEKTIPDSALSYDTGRQRLLLSIPQAALQRSARGAVGAEQWDRGVDALMLDYQINGAHHGGARARADTQAPFTSPQALFDSADPYRRDGRRARQDSLFAGLRLGANLGDWRLRNFSTYSRGLDGRERWQGVSTYLQRDLPALQGQLLVGDGNTPGNLFDSLPFRGVQIGSDDAMLPDSLQGYAPTLRGVAQTNARVTVRQNGYVIYSAFVAPGPFVIDDLYPTSGSGDLEVTIAEADGRQTRYIQAFSAVPTLLRDGAWRYSATLGRYRTPNAEREGRDERYDRDGHPATAAYAPAWGVPALRRARPVLLQGTVARGLGDGLTLYGGLLAANIYQSLMAGAGRNLRDFGAVSLDLTAARTTDGLGAHHSGQSLRFLYSKSFLSAGTHVRVAGYRYSTSGFRTFEEAVRMQDTPSLEHLHSKRNELRLELSQQIGSQGSLFASARQQSYWGTAATDRLVQVGYSGHWRDIGYSIYLNDSRGAGPGLTRNRQLMVMASLPLEGTRASAQYAVTRGRDGYLSQQASLYGSAFEDSRFNYNLSAGHASTTGRNASASASYLSSVGRLDVGHSQGSGYRQTTLGVAGGLVAHAGGLTLSQPLGDTAALVQAPRAEGVGFESRPGVATDAAGQTVIPNLSPYRLNRIAMRTQDLGDTVEVANAALEVVPTRGALVLARFDTAIGLRVLMSLRGADGRPLPLGARIENAEGREMGIVGPDGQAFVSGAAPAGRATVLWGRGEDERCAVDYALPELQNPPPIREWAGACRPPAANPSQAQVSP